MLLDHILMGKSKMIEERSHQDSYYTDFAQESVSIIREPELIEFFYTEGYWAVLAALRDQPLTVKEITIKTNEFIEKQVIHKIHESIENWEIPTEKDKLKGLLEKINYPKEERDGLIKKKTLSEGDTIKIKDLTRKFKLEKQQKSEKTIYRYIKELTDPKIGLVVQAGRRIIAEQTATEAIYARKAKVFLLREHADDTWRCDLCLSTLEKVSKLVALSTKKKAPTVESLAKLMSSIDTFHEDEQIRLFEQYEEEVKEIIKECSFKETNHLLSTFRMVYILLNHEEFAQEMKECCG